jgi:uncharacterized membrane protein
MTAPVAPGQPAHPDGEAPVDRAPPASRRSVTVRVLLGLTFLVCLLAYGEKAACRDTRNWVDEFQYTRLCYSDVVALYGAEGLSEGHRPYLDSPVEYPVLLGAAMQFGAEASHLAPPTRPGGQDLAVALFFDASALLLTVAAGVVVVCTAKTAGRPGEALLVALAPAMVFHAFTNWDLLAVAFAAGGLLAWSRRAPRLAGLLLGLGAATKLYPILLLVPLGLLCLRAGRLRTWASTALWSVSTLLLVNLPVYLLAGYFYPTGDRGAGLRDVLRAGGGLGSALAPHHGAGDLVATNALLRFLTLNKTRVADWDSVPFALQYVSRTFDPGTFAPLTLTVLVVATLLVGAVAFRLRSRPRLVGLTLAAGLAVLALLGWGLPKVLTYTRRVQTLPVSGLNVGTALALLILLAGIAVLVLRAPRRPRVGQVAFLTVVAFLLTNKVYSPQYVLWLVPLAALARPRWRPFLAWQAAEVLVLVTRYYYFSGATGDTAPGLGLGWFVSAVLLRDLALIVLSALVVRDIWNPDADPVRADVTNGGSSDDPAGGVLADAPDRRRFRRNLPVAPAGVHVGV